MTKTTAMNFTRHPQTDVLIEIFSETSPGQVLTDIEVANEVARRLGARDPRWKRHMDTVRKHLQEDRNIDLFYDPKARGYRHQSDLDVVGSGDRDRKAIHRKAKKAVRRQVLGVKDYKALPPQMQVKYNTNVAMAATLASMSSPAGAKQLADVTKAGNGKLSAGQVVDLFTKKKGS